MVTRPPPPKKGASRIRASGASIASATAAVSAGKYPRSVESLRETMLIGRPEIRAAPRAVTAASCVMATAAASSSDREFFERKTAGSCRWRATASASHEVSTDTSRSVWVPVGSSSRITAGRIAARRASSGRCSPDLSAIHEEVAHALHAEPWTGEDRRPALVIGEAVAHARHRRLGQHDHLGPADELAEPLADPLVVALGVAGLQCLECALAQPIPHLDLAPGLVGGAPDEGGGRPECRPEGREHADPRPAFH